jgi:hypothetical protein
MDRLSNGESVLTAVLAVVGSGSLGFRCWRLGGLGDPSTGRCTLLLLGQHGRGGLCGLFFFLVGMGVGAFVGLFTRGGASVTGTGGGEAAGASTVGGIAVGVVTTAGTGMVALVGWAATGAEGTGAEEAVVGCLASFPVFQLSCHLSCWIYHCHCHDY